MNLIIVESPTKAKTISKFLDKSQRVEFSLGHVRDLPKSAFGIDVERDFQPKYIIPVKAKKIVAHLKDLAAKSQRIILATDEDREGEAIAWHLAQALGLGNPVSSGHLPKGDKSHPDTVIGQVSGPNPKTDNVERIVFHEITKSAIEKAFENPRAVDMNLVDAQQARRVLDRIVGYKLSPFLWAKVARRLSAGRVQSVAVRLIVEREEEIRKFQTQEYYSIAARLEIPNSKFCPCETSPAGRQIPNSIEAYLYKIDGKTLQKLDIKSKDQAEEIAADLRKADFVAANIARKETARHPLPPFTTSTLQQAAANRFGFSSKKTMFLAQRLYESGYITYMRTDSVNLSAESTAAAKKWLAENLGGQYAGAAPRQYQTKTKGAQEAHEAIRPADIFDAPEKVKLADDGQKRLYELIWRRFIASQMPAAKISTIIVEILAEILSLRDISRRETNPVPSGHLPSSYGGSPAGRQGDKSKVPNYTLKATGQRILFDGFLKIWPQKLTEKELPEINKGDGLDLRELKTEQHFTEPPPRYSEATLVKMLEELGIGRPSTYAPIISVIQERDYVVKDSGRFRPTPMGESVNHLLVEHFPKIVDVGFTAGMENNLDKIAAGEEKWQNVVREFYGPFIKNLEEKYETVEKAKKPAPEKTSEVCEQCGRPMVIRQGRFGRFLACSGFPECKNTKKIGGADQSAPATTGIRCPKCGKGEVVRRFARRGRRAFWGCSSYPECDYVSWKKPDKSEV